MSKKRVNKKKQRQEEAAEISVITAEIPSFMIADVDARTPEEWWREVEKSFDEAAGDIQGFRLETEDEAIHKTYPTDFDEVAGEYKHPQLIPFRRTDDRVLLSISLFNAKQLIPTVKNAIASRQPTPRFIYDLSMFYYYYGFVMSSYFARGSDLSQAENAQQAGKIVARTAKKKWVAIQLKALLDAGWKKLAAQQEIELRIKKIIRKGDFPEGYDKSWFEDMLRTKLNKRKELLKSTYGNNLGDIDGLTADPTPIPPLSGDCYRP
jgi:hypothetical protein